MKTLLRRISVILVLVLLVAAIAFFYLLRPSQADAEQYAVFSEYLSQSDTTETLLIQEDTELLQSVLNNPQSGKYRRFITNYSELRRHFPNVSRLMAANFGYLNTSSLRLEKHFTLARPYEIGTISEIALYAADRERFRSKFPHSRGYHRLSRIGFNHDLTEAVFYSEYICAMLCGGGEYVRMQKIHGKWNVVESSAAWVS